MAQDLLDDFIGHCRRAESVHREPCDIVLAVAPALQALLPRTAEFLKPEHYRRGSDRYGRNAVYVSPDRGISLFTLTWAPGQWTPVHDHGTWGVVAVIDGILEERNYIRMDGHSDASSGIRLERGGVTLLAPGTVTTFVPNPDHIHVTGVPAGRGPAVSLHLYGREMNNYNVYDVDNGTRRLIEVTYEV
ncbi:MAG: cysteine dioxygenase [Alphaproteobacteria bacterium]|nr:cysteine dioxygenase [Alphaproteobacteria bacterium]